MNNRILFVGGGSVGHIAPSVAVWEECQKLRPGVTAHFICSPRQDDSAFLEANDLPYTVFDAPRLSLMFPIQFLKAVKEAKTILDTQKPDVIFSKGGYVSVPLCFAAYRRKIPIVLHESDAVSGYANRIVSRFATHTCTGFPNLQTCKPANLQTSFTGNPIRSDITQGSKKQALQITGFDGSKPILLVTGGSQGAAALNDAVTSQLDDLLLRCDIIHITGRGKQPSNLQTFKPSNHYYQISFADDSLKHFYAAADIALSRAGAGSIAELCANSIPSILVPLRGVGHDHQYKNVQALLKQNACVHIEQNDLPHALLQTVHDLIAKKEKREELRNNCKNISKPDAALQIAKIVLLTLDSARKGQ